MPTQHRLNTRWILAVATNASSLIALCFAAIASAGDERPNSNNPNEWTNLATRQ